MTVLDANLLIYSYNADAPQHPAATRWLKRLFESTEAVALPWITAWAFLRVSTNSRIWTRPRPATDAFAFLRGWLAQPGVFSLGPGARHAEILEMLVRDYGVTGPLMTDAVLAALAIENGALLASTDQDFRRFPGLRWINPLEISQK